MTRNGLEVQDLWMLLNGERQDVDATGYSVKLLQEFVILILTTGNLSKPLRSTYGALHGIVGETC